MAIKRQQEALTRALQKRIRTFTRIEKALYFSIVFTAIVMAISVVYLQSRNQQVQQEITDLKSKISQQNTLYNNAKQEVNELARHDRVSAIAEKAGLSIQNGNVQKVETP